MFAIEAGVPHHQPTRFPEACALVREFIAREGNLEYRLALARRGILHLTAVDPKDDPENFEDPDDVLWENMPRLFATVITV
jgi:hypothetical protein